LDTLRVGICYRPLRIAWAIRSGDHDAFCEAVKLTHTMWGGRFNPIVVIDQDDQAKALIELFRVDLIIPIGDSDEVKAFPSSFPYLINPFFGDDLFLKTGTQLRRASVLDIHNALSVWVGAPHWKTLTDEGLRTFHWDPNDPLSNVFLLQYGTYPDPTRINIDYGDILSRATMALDVSIDNKAPIPPEVFDHPSIAFLTRYRLTRHHTIRAGWDYPGFFVGSAGNLDDLVCFWNLRAADIHLQFIDPEYISRFELLIPQYQARLTAELARRDTRNRALALWTRETGDERVKKIVELFGEQQMMPCIVGPLTWNGHNVRPPMMIFGEETSLGVFGTEYGRPKVSFAFNVKPFSDDLGFATQHLIASLSLDNADEQHTFQPPYIPELNEFFARSMYVHYDRLRVEPERVGIVIDAADHNSYLSALPVSELIEQIFGLAGIRAKRSASGLIVRQLISRLGGVDGGRVFKIPGVRRLLKTFGPMHAFTKRAALQIIGGKDPANPNATFDDYYSLYIEPRPMGTNLTPEMVFGYMVEKGLFRIGVELKCPTCNLPSWIALDTLKQVNVCDLCGAEYDATRQLVKAEFQYRRTGVLGLEKHSQGAVPVALVLQQLHINLNGLRHGSMYAPSYEVEPNQGSDIEPCEIDFIVVFPSLYPDRTQIVFGECKDVGGRIALDDLRKLNQVAAALPRHRFDTYLMLAKLSPFTPQEIEAAKALNGPYQHRVILLTDRELEPYRLYARSSKELGREMYGGSPKRLAEITYRLYFAAQSSEQANT
jgi:hypothetical protein